MEQGRKRGVLDVLTPFLKPSLSNDGDIAHGSFTPSLMPLHACSTERERERVEGRRGAALPASASLSLPSFLSPLVRWLARAVSPSAARAHTHTQTQACVLAACRSLPVVAYLRASLPPSSSPPPPPPPPPLSFPLQTFLLSSSDSAWKEVKAETYKVSNRMKGELFTFSAAPPSLQNLLLQVLRPQSHFLLPFHCL